MQIAFEAPFPPTTSAGTIRRVLLSALVVAALGPLALNGVARALDGPPETGWMAGTVHVTGAGAVPLFSVSDLRPGRTITRRAEISYDGSVPASVRVFGRVTGTGLARCLVVRISRSGDVLFWGALSSLPSSWDEAAVDPVPWSPGERRSYRFDVTMTAGPGAQGLTAGVTFRWEARPAG